MDHYELNGEKNVVNNYDNKMEYYALVKLPKNHPYLAQKSLSNFEVNNSMII